MSAAALHQPAADLTRDQLQMAYRHLARPGWPNSLDEALRVYSYATAIRGLARNFGRRRWHAVTGRPSSLPCGPVPPTPSADELMTYTRRPIGSIARSPAAPLAGWPAAAQRGAHDCKRAAANDIDKD